MQATGDTLCFQWGRTPYSHQARCGTFTLLHASNGKKCGTKNKYLLTFDRSASPKKPPTLRRKNPQTPRKNFLSNVKKFISEVKIPFLGQKKEEKTRLFRALSSSLVQRYNIFRRNPNRFNISQHTSNVNLQRFAADGGWRVLYYEGEGE